MSTLISKNTHDLLTFLTDINAITGLLQFSPDSTPSCVHDLQQPATLTCNNPQHALP